MNLAVEHDVDMVIQGGDLFHSNRPSRQSMYNVIKSIRKTCLGDKPVQMEMLNHGMFDMDDEDLDHVNYEDPNLNVAIPLFAISGNHDDAGGQAMLSAMDVLSATGLVNHFGRVFDLREVTVEPILLKKGDTKLALYGLASIREQRLKQALRDNCIRFKKPPNAESEWYNLMMVHQNHYAHSQDLYLPETALPEFLDTVVWGHEHECLIDPVTNENNTKVIQPGSSVATSLSEGEAVKKQVCIISVTGKTAQFENIPLKSVRPFVMEKVILQNAIPHLSGYDNKGKVTQWMMDKVNELLEKAKDEWLEENCGPPSLNQPSEEVPLPLIRLHVDYTGGYEVENPTRFSNRFRGKVANDNDIVLYARKRNISRRANNDSSKAVEEEREEDAQEAVPDEPGMNEGMVHQLAEEYLSANKLEVLLESSLGDAVKEFVQGDSSKTAVKQFVDDALLVQMENLLKTDVAGDNSKELLRAMEAGKSLQTGYKPKKEEQQPKKAKAAPARKPTGSGAASKSKASESKPSSSKATTPVSAGRGRRTLAKDKNKDEEEVVISDSGSDAAEEEDYNDEIIEDSEDDGDEDYHDKDVVMEEDVPTRRARSATSTAKNKPVSTTRTKAAATTKAKTISGAKSKAASAPKKTSAQSQSAKSPASQSSNPPARRVRAARPTRRTAKNNDSDSDGFV